MKPSMSLIRPGFGHTQLANRVLVNSKPLNIRSRFLSSDGIHHIHHHQSVHLLSDGGSKVATSCASYESVKNQRDASFMSLSEHEIRLTPNPTHSKSDSFQIRLTPNPTHSKSDSLQIRLTQNPTHSKSDSRV